MVKAERVRDVIVMFVPVVLGIIFIIWATLNTNWGVFAFGAGMLGIPGLTESVRGVSNAGTRVRTKTVSYPASD